MRTLELPTTAASIARDAPGACDPATVRPRSCLGARMLLLLIVVVVMLPVGPAFSATGDDHFWRFSASLGLVAQAQDATGSVRSSFPARSTFDPSIEDDPVILVPAIPLGLRIDAPRIRGLSRGVRPFLHARVVVPMDEDRSIVRQGTLPNPVEIPVDLPASLGAESISGQGSLLRAKLDLSGQVGAGLSIDFPILDHPSRLGVSLDYLAQETTLDGDVVYVRGTGPSESAPFTVQRLHALDSALFHFVGPRVETELDVWQEGAIQIAVFAEIGALFSVGDRSRSFVLRRGPDVARFELEIDPWIIQAGVGIRLSWRGPF